MENTCAKGFLVGVPGGKVTDSMKDKSVGNANRDHIWHDSHYRYCKAIADMDGEVSTGQTSNTYVLPVCVGSDEHSAERL